jgi:hypothetical protein
MRLSNVAALVLVVGATSSVSVSLARAASDCPTSVTVSDWGENSTGYFNVASGGSCLFPIKIAASRAIRQAEVGASKTMIERTQERFDIKPERLAGDTAYGSGNWLVKDKDIAPHTTALRIVSFVRTNGISDPISLPRSENLTIVGATNSVKCRLTARRLIQQAIDALGLGKTGDRKFA